ncbi:DUF6265 family protein [Pedobacter montanisoli]|uniref:DUF6265 family protein n=1 Tax=Pedobacter montanisoli TaxID=2923277 RepID=A0ABS9ZXP3_9SPHI|nr:DUF6265 family protein [Pedobacter montanisoli]MCJ0743096.1 DUF6265 family protein [Pedobacter montanisoli]
MKKTNYSMVLTGLIMLCSYSAYAQSQIKKAEWLTGTWENKTSRGNLYEEWKKAGKHELAGKSYMLKEKDTIVFETLRLVAEGNGLFYIPTVKNQNDGKPVKFALKTLSDTQLVFENPQHDFPQLITYTKIKPDSLVAEISGTRNGQLRKQTFPMKKVK